MLEPRLLLGRSRAIAVLLSDGIHLSYCRTFLAPVAIGLTLFIGHLASIGWTGAGMNPARTFGPQVVTGSFVSYSWLYYVGPFLGAVLATILCQPDSCSRPLDSGLVQNVKLRQGIRFRRCGAQALGLR